MNFRKFWKSNVVFKIHLCFGINNAEFTSLWSFITLSGELVIQYHDTFNIPFYCSFRSIYYSDSTYTYEYDSFFSICHGNVIGYLDLDSL